nr:hypothetical protein [Lachnospiraceae bacterium]
MGRVTLFNNFIAKYRAAIVIGLITMALLYWFVLYDGDGYIFQISPAFNGKEMQVQAINDHSVEEQIPFHAHDLEHLVLHFDLQQERSDYSDTRIIIEILQKDRPLGLWELSAEQTNAPYDCYVYTNLHNLPAENLTLKISAKGTGKVGIVVGETTEGVSVDYRAFVTSYSRARLLLTFFAVLL